MSKETNEELKKRFKTRDRVVTVLTENEYFRCGLIRNTNSVRDAQLRHKAYDISGILMARQMSAASLMASFLKGEERLIIDIDGDGPIRKLYAEAMQLGEVRGYVRLNGGSDFTGIEDISDALGGGLMRVTRVLYNRPQPIQGIVPLIKGDITSDIAYYFTMSEQIPTAIVLDVDIDDNGVIQKSSGLIVQALPNTPTSDLDKMNELVTSIKSLNSQIDSEISLEENLGQILNTKYSLLKNAQVDFFCRCSKDKFLTQLSNFGIEEVRAMKNENANQLTCQYCNNTYIITDQDFNKTIEDLQAQLN